MTKLSPGIDDVGPVLASGTPEVESDPDHHDFKSAVVRTRELLSPKNVSALYVAAALFVLFSIWIPNLFLSSFTFTSTINENVVTCLVALGLVYPVVCGVFDLSIAYTLGLSSTLMAWLNINDKWSIWLAILVALAVAIVVGVVNGMAVTLFHIDSFMATLGTGSVLLGLIYLIGGGKQLIGLDPHITTLANDTVSGVAKPVVVLLVIAVAMWYVLEQMPLGRYIQATGAGPDAARLAGVRTNAYIFGSLVVSALVGGVGGVVLTAQLGASSPDYANQFLLPAFAAVFLGSTQLRGGRANIWGTVLAVFVLALGSKGFNLAGVQTWIDNVFYGAALLAAVGLTAYKRRQVKRVARSSGPRLARLRGRAKT